MKDELLEALSEGIIAVDASLIITSVNQAALRFLGVPKESVLGKEFSSLQVLEIQDFLDTCSALIKFSLKEEKSHTETITCSHRHKLHLDITAVPRSDHLGAVLILRDNSDHYRVLEMGKEFVANASHELRTPITIIKGFAETLHEMPTIEPKKLKEITATMMRSCERMEKLVKNLLILSDLEHLPLTQLECKDLTQVLAWCKEVISTLYPEVTLMITSQQPHIHTLCASDLLELAFLNILQNAIKYSTDPASIQVYIEKKQKEIEIQFIDQGIGIHSHDIDHIFERFYRVDKARSRKLGGAGLGLPIVKIIVEKHNGRIFVESTPEEGSKFTIILPVQDVKSDKDCFEQIKESDASYRA